MQDKLIASLLVFFVLSISSLSLAELVLIEDFELRTPGSINMQGQTTYGGIPIVMWNAQGPESYRSDSYSANVVNEGVTEYWPCGGDYSGTWSDDYSGLGLSLENLNYPMEPSIVYATMALGDEYSIDDIGTVYMLFKTDSPNSTLLALNGLLPGYESGRIEANGLYQGLYNYSSQAALVELSGGEGVRFYDSTIPGYQIDDLELPVDQWCEIWIHIDCQAKASRFYVCQAGEDPELLLNSEGFEWIPWRDTTHDVVSNLKWFVGFHDDITTKVVIDNIAVDTQGYSLDSFWTPPPPPWPIFDLDDFIIFKQHYGMGPDMSWSEGDYTEDGWVNLDDFVFLKQHYGRKDY